MLECSFPPSPFPSSSLREKGEEGGKQIKKVTASNPVGRALRMKVGIRLTILRILCRIHKFPALRGCSRYFALPFSAARGLACGSSLFLSLSLARNKVSLVDRELVYVSRGDRNHKVFPLESLDSWIPEFPQTCGITSQSKVTRVWPEQLCRGVFLPCIFRELIHCILRKNSSKVLSGRAHRRDCYNCYNRKKHDLLTMMSDTDSAI